MIYICNDVQTLPHIARRRPAQRLTRRAGRFTVTEVKGPIPSTRPWARYEFVDPRLEGLAAGQKIVLRIGPEHATRLKAWLRALRDAPTRAAPPR